MLKRERFIYQEGMYQEAVRMYGTEDCRKESHVNVSSADSGSKSMKKKRKKSKSKKKKILENDGKAHERYQNESEVPLTSDEQKLLSEDGWHCASGEEQNRRKSALRSLHAKMVSETLRLKDAEINNLKSQLSRSQDKLSRAQKEVNTCKDSLTVASNNATEALEVSKKLKAENSELKVQISQMRGEYTRTASEDQSKINSLKRDLFDSSCEVGKLQHENRKLAVYTKLTLDKYQSKCLAALEGCKRKLQEKQDCIEALEKRNNERVFQKWEKRERKRSKH